MARKQYPMTVLREKLAQHGIKKAFVDQILPSYWEDHLSEERTAYMSACAILSRALDLELRPLLEDEPVVQPRESAKPFYKKTANKTEADLDNAARVGTVAARIALQAFDRDFTPLPADPMALREAILGSGRDWVDLEGLLKECWTSGIPVIYAKHLAGKKMDAMAVNVEGRPAIMVARASQFRSYVAFWIAHELGHIALGHLNDWSVIADAKINRASDDALEQAADQYALALLFGNSEIAYKYAGDVAYPDALAVGSKKLGLQTHVDPAAIINNWCFHELRRRKDQGLSDKDCQLAYGTATAARRLVGDLEDALEFVDAWAKDHLEGGHIPRDSATLFKNLTELDLAA